MIVLVTGSSGLIGSEAVAYFDQLGFKVIGVDNNMRRQFFGPSGDTEWNRRRLERTCDNFTHLDLDIRDREAVDAAMAAHKPDVIVHAAAQPSHDYAATDPFADFDVNAVGTLNLLQSCRVHCIDSPFIYLSTNKVYGDGPNMLELTEGEQRYDFADPAYANGIAETFSIDQSMHSLFGVSKCAADLMVQEYGRYFDMKTAVLRGGCLTGPAHSAVELHGFLSYLVDCALCDRPYTIFGYKGKQVRDQIHSSDVISAIWEIAQDPRPGEVYNIGGGKDNSASVLECIGFIEQRTGAKIRWELSDQNRMGDHICYYTDLSKLKRHYPNWSITRSLDSILDEMIASRQLEADRQAAK
jgi:CDP-paratose 2-epimerase